MMSYLIDTENVGVSWVHLLTSLLPGDKLCLYYSKNSPSIPPALLDAVIQRQVRFEMVQCEVGTNAMDFQLVSDLGRQVVQNPKDVYVIVSRDTGYDPVIPFWTRRGISVKRLVMPVVAQKDLWEILDRISKMSPLKESSCLNAESPCVMYMSTASEANARVSKTKNELASNVSAAPIIKPTEKHAACIQKMCDAGASLDMAKSICEFIDSTKQCAKNNRRNAAHEAFVKRYGASKTAQNYYKLYMKEIAFKEMGV